MNMRKEKGITLIELAVTIIVLIILAGVTVRTLTGDEGLIEQAKTTKAEKIDEQVKKSIQTELLEKKLENSSGEISNEKIVAILEKYGTINYDSNGNIESLQVTETDTEIPFDELYNQNVKTVADGVTIPDGFYYVGGSKNTGLVISDNIADKEKYKGKSNVGTDLEGNQFVWIPVQKTTTVYTTAGLSISDFSVEELTKIENDLHTYTKDYRADGFVDEYYADTSTEGWFAYEEDYNILKRKMLKSIYQKEGFFVGRYEAGISNYRTEPTTPTEIPQSKANLYPYTYVRRSQAKMIAEKIQIQNSTVSLLFGVQWDLMLAFIHNEIGIDNNVLISDSKTIGNNKDTLWNITSAYPKYLNISTEQWASCPFQKNDNTQMIVTTTGANSSFKLANIYDISGNLWEWTLEGCSNNASKACVFRSGSVATKGNSRPAAKHTNYNGYGSDGGFRIAIY